MGSASTDGARYVRSIWCAEAAAGVGVDRFATRGWRGTFVRNDRPGGLEEGSGIRSSGPT